MSGAIKINGTSSGSTTITAPASGGDESIELSTALAAKGDVAGETWTGTHDFSGATLTGVPAGLTLMEPTSIAYTGTSASTTAGMTVFSACTAISLNGVFTSDYLSYRIVLTGLSASAATDCNMRLRASGADNTASSYRYGRYFCGLLDATALTASTNVTTNVFRMAYVGTTQSGMVIDVYSPMTTGRTTITAESASQYRMTFGGIFDNTSNFDGFTLSGGTFSGRMAVYAYEGSA